MRPLEGGGGAAKLHHFKSKFKSTDFEDTLKSKVLRDFPSAEIG